MQLFIAASNTPELLVKLKALVPRRQDDLTNYQRPVPKFRVPN